MGEDPVAGDSIPLLAKFLADDSANSHLTLPLTSVEQVGKLPHDEISSKILALQGYTRDRAKSIVVRSQHWNRLSERRLALRKQQIARMEERQAMAIKELQDLLELKQYLLTLDGVAMKTSPAVQFWREQHMVDKESESCRLEGFAAWKVEMGV